MIRELICQVIGHNDETHREVTSEVTEIRCKRCGKDRCRYEFYNAENDTFRTLKVELYPKLKAMNDVIVDIKTNRR